MIDESWIKEAEGVLRLYPNGTHAIIANKETGGAWMLDAEKFSDMLRLARLGLRARDAHPTMLLLSLWARDVAKPALEEIKKMWIDLIESGDAGFWDANEDKHVILLRSALSQFPQDPKEPK